MSINDIALSSAMIASLYPDSLVGEPAAENTPVISREELPSSSSGDTSIKFLGNNQKKILILVDQPATVFLPDEELSFLTDILSACQLSLADVCIVNRAHSAQAGFKDYNDKFHPGFIILFDVEPAGLGLPINFPHYQVQPFSGQTFLYAPPLHSLANNRPEKAKLWTSLKKIFNI